MVYTCDRCGQKFKWDKHYQKHLQRISPCKKSKNKNNLMLHAHKIHFKINNLKYNFTADIPEYFNRFLKEKYLKIYFLLTF